FPGMGYPLVPGYESVGRVTAAGASSGGTVGDRVFVGGASCFGEIRGLFGGAASRLVVAGQRVVPLADDLGGKGGFVALAATALHSIAGGKLPDLIIGPGVLGRLLARIALALGGEPPLVWELNPERAAGASGYRVEPPESGERGKFRSIYDVSGDPKLL